MQLKTSMLTTILVIFLSLANFAFGHDTSNWHKAKQLVQKASIFSDKYGILKLIDAVNNNSFTTNDSYIFVISTDNILLAHPYQKNNIGRKAPLNKKHRIKMLDIINRYGNGWLEYNFTDPKTGKVLPKISYIKQVSAGIFIGAGVY